MVKLGSKKSTLTRGNTKHIEVIDDSIGEREEAYQEAMKSFTGATPTDLVTDSHYILLEYLLKGDNSDNTKKYLTAFKSENAKLRELMLFMLGYKLGQSRNMVLDDQKHNNRKTEEPIVDPEEYVYSNFL